jgi:osmotically-inducible protein OsmY
MMSKPDKGGIPMSKSRPTALGTIALFLIGLSGCATYEKCGIEGCAGDRKITANIRAAFEQHPELGPPNSINVETINHVVYLTGHVSEGAMRSIAESVASRVEGVAHVEDTVYVTK